MGWLQCSYYTLGPRGLDKIQSMLDPQRQKIVFSHLATVLLACMEQRKNPVAPYHHRKNIYIFASGYSTTGMHGTKKKSSRTLPSPKKYIYFRVWLQYYWHAWNKEKIQSHPTITEKIYIFSHLATVLLACMEQRKNPVAPYHHRKNIYIFASGYSTTGMHGTKKKSSRTLPSPKKYIYFRIWLQYYWHAWNKEKIQSHPTI